MGKHRRNRTKLHIAAAKLSSDRQALGADDMMHVDEPICSKPGSLIAPSDGGAFSKLDIDLAMLTKSLNQGSGVGGDNFDTRSSVTGKSLKGLGLKKKEKQQLRHEIWVKKVNIMEERKKEEKDRKRREKTAVVGDMRALSDSLPTIDLLLRSTSGSASSNSRSSTRKEAPQRKVRGIEKESFRKKQTMEEIAMFQAVLQHPAYQANPLDTIVEHLTNKMLRENSSNK